MGYEVGDSLVEESMLEDVTRIVAEDEGVDKIKLPATVVVGDRFAEDAAHEVVDIHQMPAGWMGLDIGPTSAENLGRLIEESASVFWNGPMGVFEWEAFRAGTETVARAMGRCSGFTAVGGGDSVAALRLLGLEGTVSHVSTGGGAGLELLEGKILPGVQVLERWVR
jgi:phosphoglycerate kinase